MSYCDPRPRCARCNGRITLVLTGTVLSIRCQRCGKNVRRRPSEGK